MKKTLLFAGAALLILAACDRKTVAEANGPDPIAEHVDSSITPGQNFFLFANNAWFKSHPIPASEKSNGIFRTIQDTINEAVKKICISASQTKAEKGSNKQKIGDLYASGMDTVTIDKLGTQPVQPFLQEVASIKTQQDLVHTISHFYAMGMGTSFGFYIPQDDKNSSKYALYFTQPRQGLPDRDYYFNTDSSTTQIRVEYLNHMRKMFILFGYDETKALESAKKVMALETALAKASRKMEDLRDPYKNYNKKSLAEFNALTPAIDWTHVLGMFGIKNADSVVVCQPEYFTALNTQLSKTSIDDWKEYLNWSVINSSASFLSKAIEDQNFYFYSTVLEGVKEKKPRWKNIVEITDNSLGELIGQVYVAEYLPKGTKEKLLEIGNNIRDVYALHIRKLDWMSAVTKEKALSKLAKINMKVGYPDKWKDMSSLNIERGTYAMNMMNVGKWQFEYMIQKFGKPVDKSEWGMYPQTYNAYYDPGKNEICVPACNIIVPGFEGRMPDDAVLYGIIGGSTFGHEITHGFDDQGSQYDENGNLSDWWTAEDRARFVERTKAIVEQYNEFTVLGGTHVRGENTQGENIADLGGLVMGYEAFKKTKQGQSKELFAGYTADQRFFLSYAYAWMVNRTDASLAKQIMSDVHSPAEFRINGPVANMNEFYAAFNVKKGEPMWRDPAKRIAIW